MFGRLEPPPCGDPIPLLLKRNRVGSREGCDIVLNYPDVSSHHAMLDLEEGYWFVRDLKSRNGVKVGGMRVMLGIRKRLDPDVIVAFARHEFIIRYDPRELGAFGTPPQDETLDDLFKKSLLDRAGSGSMAGVRPRFGPRDHPPLGGAAEPPE